MAWDEEICSRTCAFDVCQMNKHENMHIPGLLQPIESPDGPWKGVCMDFLTGLPKSDGKDIILVVVDRFTKFAHFLPLSHPISAPKV